MNTVKFVLISLFLFSSFVLLTGCDDKKSKYQHPSVRNGSI